MPARSLVMLTAVQYGCSAMKAPTTFGQAVAELDYEHAAWAQEFGRLGDELRVDVEAVFAGEKGFVRFVRDDFALQV